MIFLEQTVNQILREEGQVIVTLDDLQISWNDMEELFVGVFEQAKQYISIYDWVEDTLSTTQQQRSDWAHVRHITYNAYNNMQRFMPDVPGQYYEFNPYTKNANSLINTNFSLEVSKHPTIEQLEYELPLTLKNGMKKPFMLPCTFEVDTFSFDDMEAYPDERHPGKLILEGSNAVGMFDEHKLTGYIVTDKDINGTLKVTSKYVGIKELDLSCELFYTWFKGAVMCYVGAQKRQLDLTGIGLPFDINADGLLERGRMLIDKVEELKGTKQHWSNF